MIYCVWYPSGGFGRFINGILTLFGENFARPQQTEIKFSEIGDSHALDLVAPVYRNQCNYQFDFDPHTNYSVLIDNGISYESQQDFKNYFPQAKIIKICYSDFSWPVISQTFSTKALRQPLDALLDSSPWQGNNEDWAQREKYFLFLRDNWLRKCWQPSTDCATVWLEDFMCYNKLKSALESAGVIVNDFESLWQQWWSKNRVYFDPVSQAQQWLQGNWNHGDHASVWNQAVFYYQIWCTYGIEVPHNTYSNWFSCYQDVTDMLTKQGVVLDSH